MKIPDALIPSSRLGAYSSEDWLAKKAFHFEGAKFLRGLAAELGLPKGSYHVRSNKGGAAVSGEITLHHQRLYLWIEESFTRKVILTYRSCEGFRDYTGGPNNTIEVAELRDASRFSVFLDHCRRIVNRDTPESLSAA
jgi:hypothetical protein